MTVEELLKAMADAGVTAEGLKQLLIYAAPVFEINQRQQKILALQDAKNAATADFDAQIVAEQQAIDVLEKSIRPKVS